MAQAITVTDIRKNFGAVEALKGVSLDVAEGEKVVVIGPSGSGKSVLIRCINGLEVPDSGTVVVEGMNLSDRKVNARALARDVAMVFQSYNLYPHKTVLENVTLAPIKVLKVPREAADKVVFMENGLVVDQGTPHYLFDETDNARVKSFLSKIL